MPHVLVVWLAVLGGMMVLWAVVYGFWWTVAWGLTRHPKWFAGGAFLVGSLVLTWAITATP